MQDEQQQTTTETSEVTTEATSPTEQVSDTQTTETLDLSQTDDQPAAAEEQKAVEDETEEQKAEREEREALFGAPAEGEAYVLEGLPEGTVVDEEALKAIEPVARKLGLSSKGLSEIAGVYATDVLPHVAQQVVTGIEQDVTAKRTEWEGEARDAIAGKIELVNASGDKLSFNDEPLPAVKAMAAKALDRLAPEGFREFLEESGLGLHPKMIAFAYQAGKLIAEDRDIETADKTTDRTSAADRRKAGGMDTKKFFNRT